MTFLNRKLIISKNKITKWYSIFLSLLPIISIYSSGIPGLNAGDVFLIIFLLISFRYKNDKKKKIDYIFLCCYCIYILTIPLIISIVNMKTLNEVIIRTFRFCFYVFSILRTSQLFFDYKIFRTYVIKVCIIASFFLIVQQIAYNIFNIYIKGYIPSMNLYTAMYSSESYHQLILENMYRPSAFFLEPAHCARYCIIGLIFLLDDVKNRRNLLKILLICLGIVLTTSGQGIMLLVVYSVFFLLEYSKKITKNQLCFMIVIICLFFAIFIILNLKTGIISNNLSRVFNSNTTNASLLGGAIGERIGNLFYYIDNFNILSIFGNGFGNVMYKDAWMSGITYSLYGAGLVGTVFILLIIGYTVLKKNRISKYCAIIFFMLFITDDLFNTFNIILYFSSMLYIKEVDLK